MRFLDRCRPHRTLNTIALATAILFALVVTTAAFVQGERNKFSTELSSVKDLHIEAGPLGEQAKNCGLTVTDLTAPAGAALEAARLRVIQTASDFVFVNANVIAAGGVCTAAIDVELFRYANEFRAQVSVWRHTAMIPGASSSVAVEKQGTSRPPLS